MKKSMNKQQAEEALQLSAKIIQLIEEETENSHIEQKFNIILNSLTTTVASIIASCKASENDAYELSTQFFIHLTSILLTYFQKEKGH